MKKNYCFFSLLLVIFLSYCKSSILKKKDLEILNKELVDKKFVALENLPRFYYNFKKNYFETLSQEKTLTKGTKVKIVIESSEDWLRIRAYDITKDKKNYNGEILLFLYVDEDEDIKLDKEFIREIINSFIKNYFKEIS